MKKFNLIFIVLAVLISSIGLISLFRPGFFLSDDGNSMIIRFSAFYEALRSGQFPVRFLPRLNYNFGYPVSDFLYPLFMYIGVPIHILGFSFVNTIKMILGLSFLSGTVFSFLWLRRLFNDKSALMGSIVYSLFPYHLYDIYKRGSVGEVLALGIVPFVLWQIERRSFFWTSIGIFFLILSHNILAVLFLIFFIFYGFLDIYVNRDRKSLIKFYISSVLIGLGFSSFFSIPAIFDLQYTVFSKTQVSDWSRYFISFDLIGILGISIFFVILIFFVFNKNQLKKHRLTILMFFVGLISIFFASSASSFLWNLLPVSFIQFPFRFLSLTDISTAFLASFVFSIPQDRIKKFWTIFLIFALLAISLGVPHYAPISDKYFLSPEISQNYPDSFYSTNQDSTTVRNEYMPKWVKISPNKMPSQEAQIVKGEGEINNLTSKGSFLLFNLNLKEKSLVQVNKVYFPGWRIILDGKETQIFYDNKYGIIQFEVEKGNHFVRADFIETRVRLIADLISIFSLILLFYFSKKHEFS